MPTLRRTSPWVVKAPAIAMMIVIGLQLLATLGYLLLIALHMPQFEQVARPGNSLPPIGVIVTVLMILLPMYVTMFVGAWRMMQHRNWGLALTSAILMLPCTICWIGFPVGIWAIVVLSTQRDQFS